ncbi:MAG: acyltransferase [Candidatus Thorarchaeota archaeon]|nr:acyltransferase [Candidatus Thorarchaeota archaeon]
MNVESVSRFRWIDGTKGLGIIAVMIVHSMIPMVNVITTHLSAFAIQLFFVVTGFTYHNEKYREQLRRLFVVRGRQLLIPYVLLYALVIILFIPMAPYIETYLTPSQLVFWFLYGSGPPMSSSHLWFLPVLFFGLVVFAVLDKLSARIARPVRLLWLILLSLLAWWIKSLFGSALVPWHLNAILIAAAYMFLGNEIRLVRKDRLDVIFSPRRNVIVILLSVPTFLVISTINGFTDLAVDNTGISIWLYMIAGLLGSIMCISLSQIITYYSGCLDRLMTLFGKHSQVVYELHPLVFYLSPLVVFLVGLALGDGDVSAIAVWPIRLLLATTLTLPLVLFVIERHAPLRLLFRGTTKERS